MKNKNLKKGVLTCLSILILGCLITLIYIKKINFGLDLKGGFEVLYLVESLDGKEITNDDILATYKSIGNRIDTLGVSEPEIIIEGNKIRVKLPGVQNEDEARERLTTPAVLTFRDTSDELLMTASVLDSPGASFDYDPETHRPVVALKIKDKDTFYNVTKRISESTDQTITIWLDYQEGDKFENTTCGETSTKCISAASVKEAFASNVIIQGNFTEEEAQTLVDLINSGSLPTKLTEIGTKTVDASYGNKTIELLLNAGIITLVIIEILLISLYRLSGLISTISLILYCGLLFLIYYLIDGVLTLTGIAALILGIGMAVDSCVITIEKIKEEISYGKTLKEAYSLGNKRSLVSLIDANITTFLAALVLFIFGESSVKGFATMLMLTIVVTAISMVFINRFLLKNFIESEKFNKNYNWLLGKVKKFKIKNHLKLAKYNIIVILVILVIGIISFFTSGLKLGVDFSGGSAITLNSEKTIEIEDVKKELSNYKIVEVTKINEKEYYLKIEETLESQEINKVKEKLNKLELTSDISVVSNIVKKDLTINAIKSLIIAICVILIYICIRFNFNYAVASILTILSDVVMTVCLFIILRIEINFIFVASLLTILGYSINDTIVVFDMIRDKLKRKENIDENILATTVNESISITLKRNIITTITTLIAVIILLLLNANGIQEFNLAILFGLFFGLFSSLYMGPYIWSKLETHSINNPKEKNDDEENEPEEKIIKGING